MEAIYSAFCLIYLSASSPFNARDMHVEKAKTGESTARGGLSRDLFELPFLSQMPKDGENVFFFSPRFMSAYYPRDSREPQTAHRLISRPRTKEEKVQIAASGHLLKSFSQKKGAQNPTLKLLRKYKWLAIPRYGYGEPLTFENITS